MKNKEFKPLLTVIVPVFNTAGYLAKCLDSVLNQSLKNIEILVINDQCTDGSDEVIQKYKDKHESIKCFATESKSLAGGARNIGLKFASGEYIGFVDSDDWIDSNMYQKLINSLEKSGADIAICGVIKEYENREEAYVKYSYDFENVLDGKFAFELLCNRLNQDIAISPIVCNKVYRKNFLHGNNIEFLENNYNEDDVFNYYCFLKANKVVVTPDAYYHYYQRNNSITHSFSKKHIDDLVDGFGVIKKFLERNGQFELYKNQYYSYFEKCLGFVLNLMILKESDQASQNGYLQYLFGRIHETIFIPDYFEYCGVQRLNRFFNPMPIK